MQCLRDLYYIWNRAPSFFNLSRVITLLKGRMTIQFGSITVWLLKRKTCNEFSKLWKKTSFSCDNFLHCQPFFIFFMFICFIFSTAWLVLASFGDFRYWAQKIHWNIGGTNPVGGFNPLEKYESKWESSPIFCSENEDYLSCHHLEIFRGWSLDSEKKIFVGGSRVCCYANNTCTPVN